jgi:hypothetical protein
MTMEEVYAMMVRDGFDRNYSGEDERFGTDFHCETWVSPGGMRITVGYRKRKDSAFYRVEFVHQPDMSLLEQWEEGARKVLGLKPRRPFIQPRTP